MVRSERPTSGKPGNAALIDPDGTMHGWIGGSCTRSEVIRHALEALRLGEPRLLAFGTDEERPDDLVKVSMSCASGGKVEVHINPVLPAPVLLVAGDSPVALALLGLGRAMGYRTVAAGSAGEAAGEELADIADERAEDLAGWVGMLASRPPGTRFFAVVATMGREDERTLASLAAPPRPTTWAWWRPRGGCAACARCCRVSGSAMTRSAASAGPPGSTWAPSSRKRSP